MPNIKIFLFSSFDFLWYNKLQQVILNHTTIFAIMRNSSKKILFLLLTVFSISLFAFPAFGAELTWLGRPVVDRVNELTLYILKIVGGIFLLMLVLGGIYYSISGSNPNGQNKAKKMVTSAVIGLVIILIPYTIISNMHEILVKKGISIKNASVAPSSGPIGTDFIITATITAPAGVNPATTIAHIQDPDESPDVATITLVDDGTGDDLAAGDDIYTGAWTSVALGSYFVDIDACDTAGNCTEAENI